MRRAASRPAGPSRRVGPLRQASASRRGVTLLETVFGVTLLGLTAASFASAVAAIGSGSEKQQQRLGAMELANRLVLTHLDDPESLPDPTLAVAYGKWRFRWSREILPMLMTPSDTAAAVEGAATSASEISKRCETVVLKVWLSEESGGSYGFSDLVPNATMGRLVNRLNFARNADAMTRTLNTSDPARMQQLLREFIGSGVLRDGDGGGTPSRGGRPARTPSGAGGGSGGSGGTGRGGTP